MAGGAIVPMFLAVAELAIVGIAIAIVVGIVQWRREHQRQEALLAWAHEEGFAYLVGKDYGIAGRLAHFDAFSSGSDRYARHLMHGRRGERRVECFDFHYETYSTDSKGRRTTHHHWSSNVVIHVDWPMQPLAIRGETWLDKVGSAFGFDDIDFESNEFSRAFHVKARDRRWAFDVVSTRTMEILLQSPRFRLEMGGFQLLVRRTSLMGPAEYGAALVLGLAFLDAIPADVVRERTARAATAGFAGA